MSFKMREEFWTTVLAMVFAELRETRWKDAVLNISIRTGGGSCRLGHLLPFGLDTEVLMCTDLHRALAERAEGPPRDRKVPPAECKGQPDLWVEDAHNVLFVENKTTADKRLPQEEQYSRCLQLAAAFGTKTRAFFYAIPRSYLGPGNQYEHLFLTGGNAGATRGLLLWDEEFKQTVSKMLHLSDCFLREFPL